MVGRGKPVHVGVFGVPGELFFCVDTGVFLNASHGGVVVHRAVHPGKQFLIAHGVERVEVSLRIETPCFVDESGFYHFFHAAVDTVEELFARQVESDFQNAERPLLHAVGAQFRIGASCL